MYYAKFLYLAELNISNRVFRKKIIYLLFIVKKSRVIYGEINV